MASLSTHVLDTVHGKPAEGIAVELERVSDDERRTLLMKTVTNKDGRPIEPLSGDDLPPGVYELRFQAGDYFKRNGLQLPDPPFLDDVVLRFGIADPVGHYHVPLLLSAYGYSTYRGS
jgi:5-hydroxyisourate hydrolase